MLRITPISIHRVTLAFNIRSVVSFVTASPGLQPPSPKGRKHLSASRLAGRLYPNAGPTDSSLMVQLKEQHKVSSFEYARRLREVFKAKIMTPNFIPIMDLASKDAPELN